MIGSDHTLARRGAKKWTLPVVMDACRRFLKCPSGTVHNTCRNMHGASPSEIWNDVLDTPSLRQTDQTRQTEAPGRRRTAYGCPNARHLRHGSTQTPFTHISSRGSWEERTSRLCGCRSSLSTFGTIYCCVRSEGAHLQSRTKRHGGNLIHRGSCAPSSATRRTSHHGIRAGHSFRHRLFLHGHLRVHRISVLTSIGMLKGT